MAAFPIRQGDRLPILEGRATYRDKKGKQQPFNFTEWKNLTFTAVGTSKTISGSAKGTNDGWLKYEWAAADTDTPGTYKGKFNGYSPDGMPQTFPTKGYIEIEITAA